MKFIDLKPKFLRIERENGRTVYAPTDFANAHGVQFLCPVCFKTNNGPVGTHGIICWSRSRGVPDSESPGPGRWTLEGGSYENLTLGCEPGKSRSVLLTGDRGCKAHFFVTNGEIT